MSGGLVFQLKKRPPDYQGRKGRKMDDKVPRGKDGSSSLPPEKLPYLVELSPGRTTTHTHTHKQSTHLKNHPCAAILAITSGRSSNIRGAAAVR